MLNNMGLAEEMFESMNVAIEAAQSLKAENDTNTFLQVGGMLIELMHNMEQTAVGLYQNNSKLSLKAALPSCLDSIQRIMLKYPIDEIQAKRKIEYELIPLLSDMRLNFYFWGMCFGDEARTQQFYEKDRYYLYFNPYYEQAKQTGNYKYEISVVIIAYNKLDYTKLCVENFLKYMPKDISYELILVNHGSTDGTKEYFESINPDKQVDIAVNGGGLSCVQRIYEGKYVLGISNDIVITENAVRNMYDCINSDERIAWVVPTTPNVSNLQTVFLPYENVDEMHACAKQNNVQDPYKWEQRNRLCDPIEMIRVDARERMHVDTCFYDSDGFAFPDDRLSCLCRRNGYKMVLVKDAYCHHYGSITINDNKAMQELQKKYMIGRSNFFASFGVDPWGKGMCYSWYLFQNLTIEKLDKINILGVDCGLGANPLKLKEIYKEKLHVSNVEITNITSEKNYVEDLIGVSDFVYEIDKKDYLGWNYEKYDYIVCQKNWDNVAELCSFMNVVVSTSKRKGNLLIELIPEVCAEYENQKKIKILKKVDDISWKSIWLII